MRAPLLGFAARRWRSMHHAANGIARLVREEVHARIHLVATILLGSAGVASGLPPERWRWLVVACALVWMAEAFNTAIERLADRVCPTQDPAIGAAKDLAAGAVLLAAIAALAIGVSLLPALTGVRS